MKILNQYIKSKTKFTLNDNQIKSIDLISQGRSLEEVFFNNKENGFDVQYWHLDLFETLVRDFGELEKKKAKIVSDIEHQNIENKVELFEQIKNIVDDSKLEDLYRPFKRRKKTKATLAREAGLADFSDWILDVAYGKTESTLSLEVKAKEFLKPALGFITYEIVLKGAQDIIVDRLLKKSEIREKLSDLYYSKSILKVEKTDKFKNLKYTSLLSFKEKVSSLLETKNYYKFPMVKKAWEEGQLKVLLEVDKSELVDKLKSEILKLEKENPWAIFVTEAFHKLVDIHLIPSITQEIIEELLLVSESETVKRLKQDYHKLLMTPAFGDKPILSFTQIKDDQFEMALVTDLGELVSSTSVLVNKDNSKDEFVVLIQGISKQISIGALAIGLSPFSRIIETFILNCFENDIKKLPAPIAFVDMRGISSYVHNAYEADRTKTKMDHTLLTIARRMQDPLSELSKYTAKSLLDIPNYVSDEKLLPELLKVLKHCLSIVGLDINKATKQQLEMIPGIQVDMADKIIEFRTQKSRFVEKQQLRSDLSMTEENFDLSSTFIKVMISKSILDRSQISGKDFPAIKDFIKDQNLVAPFILTSEQETQINDSKWKSIFGEAKLKFILKELKSPYADPRRTYKFFSFSDKLKSLAEIKVGWNYPALVTKFSSFGVFVDLGVQQEGLIHLSELSSEFVSDPRKVIGLGEWLYVHVIDYNPEKKLISLSKIKAEKSSANNKSNSKSDRSSNVRTPQSARNSNLNGKSGSGRTSDKSTTSERRPARSGESANAAANGKTGERKFYPPKSSDGSNPRSAYNKTNDRPERKNYDRSEFVKKELSPEEKLALDKEKNKPKTKNQTRTYAAKPNSKLSNGPNKDSSRGYSSETKDGNGSSRNERFDKNKDHKKFDKKDQKSDSKQNSSGSKSKTPFNNPFAALSNINVKE